jgi:16S rRNA (cytidine1402-2'-O)-methyltransferase
LLYLVATPIGNLQDLSPRALEVLGSCDYVLCEDTRRSRSLWNHFELTPPLKSFHKFNESSQEENVIEDLKQGLKIALISDAGTPGICDPGEQLVAKCWEENISIEHIPGACSLLYALVVSGFRCAPFQFIGFLPKKEGELLKIFESLTLSPSTTICFETPHRILKTLKHLASFDPKRMLFIGRELTKRFETLYRGTAEELQKTVKDSTVKGEFVVVISPSEKSEEWEDLTLEQQVLDIEEKFNYSRNEAIKLTAELRGLPKRQVYQALITNS